MSSSLDIARVRGRMQAMSLHASLEWQSEVDSTNTWAAAEASAGAQPYSWFVAGAQRAGRGRLGRTWSSPPELNLYASCVLRPAVPPARVAQTSLVVALAVRRALAPLVPDVQVKWPNDLLVSGRKVAGILCEAQFQGERLGAVVAGIGVNVGALPADLPPEVRVRATSLRDAGSEATVEDVLLAMAAALETLLPAFESTGFAPLRDEWNAACALSGRRVTLAFADQEREGVVRGLDEEGLLLLETAGGLERILAGEVTVKK